MGAIRATSKGGAVVAAAKATGIQKRRNSFHNTGACRTKTRQSTRVRVSPLYEVAEDVVDSVSGYMPAAAQDAFDTFSPAAVADSTFEAAADQAGAAPAALESVPTAAEGALDAYNSVADSAAQTLAESSQAVTESVGTASSDVLDAYKSALDSAVQTATDQVGTGDPDQLQALLSSLQDKPGLVAALAAGALAVPVLALVFGGGPSAKVVNASKAMSMLGSDEKNMAFVDLRSGNDISASGSPDLKSVGKRIVRVPVTVDQEMTAVEKIEKLFDKFDSVVLMDAVGSTAPKVGKMLAAKKYDVAFVRDGADGPNGWKSSGMPWKEPVVIIEALKGATSGVVESYREDPLSTVLTFLGTLGVGTLAFTEYDSLLEAFALLAAGSFMSRKLLFYEDRKKTLQQFSWFLKEKEAPADLKQEVKVFTDQISSKPAPKPDSDEKMERKDLVFSREDQEEAKDLLNEWKERAAEKPKSEEMVENVIDNV